MRYAWSIAVLGAWLWITPFFSAGAPFYAWDDRIVGIIAAALGVSLIARHPREGWITAAVAAWLFIAGFLGAFLTQAGLWWNSAFVGLVFLVFGIRATVETPHHMPPHAPRHAAA